MRALITGGTGLLGKALIDDCTDDVEVLATFVGEYDMSDDEQVKYHKLDIRDRDGYDNLIRNFQPDIIIHAAGIGSPDYAEANRELVRDININGTKNILGLCEKHDAKFVFISSNGIYDGNNAPYSEEDKAVPINYYGEIKLEGEEITRKAKIPFAIIRPILMYGWPLSVERENIVTLAISKLRKCEMVHAYDDVFANPLLSGSCASAIWGMINDDKFGIYNIAGADRVSVYQLIIKTAEVFGLDKSFVFPVQQGFFNELTPRPRDTSFSTEKIERELGFKPVSVSEGLLQMKRSEEYKRTAL